jgi:CelD/BcsL family acetyltransferase involved in cellulose biosynthesis
VSGEEFHWLKGDALAAWLPAYDALNTRALEPTGFNSPAWAKAITCHRGGAIAAVAAGQELHVALPVHQRRLPFPLLESRLTNIGGSGAPVLDAAHPQALASLLAGLNQPLFLRYLPTDGPLFDALRQHAAHFAIIDQWQRAALRPQGSFEDWLKTGFDGKRRGRFRRNREKLSEEGHEALSESLQPGADCTPWVEEFLALEDAGWKGKRGTALARNPADRAAYMEGAKGLHARGSLRFWRIRRDGRTIASTWAIHERDRLWMVKIAYDEALASLSPGILVMLDGTAACFAEPGLAFADSCAIPGHPMVDNFWRDRIGMADVMVAAPGVSAARFAATVAAERLWRRGRRTAKDAVYRVLGRKKV